MTDETQPWAERTVELPPPESGFRPGVARVPRSRPPVDEPHPPMMPETVEWAVPSRPPLRHRMAQLRQGGGFTLAGALFAFVCWGIWAIAARGDLTSPVLIFLLSLGVAAGLFALCRVLGRLVLERQLGRIRRGARGSHLVTGLFLVGVGVGYLRQTEWVMNLWNWVTGLG